MEAKPFDELTAEDLIRCPVWEFDNSNEADPDRDETWVVPVLDLPIGHLNNRVIAASLRLGDREALGLLGNIDLDDVRSTREFLTLSVNHQGYWFHLARYFDPGQEQRGPGRLAAFLDLTPEEMFPIRYEITAAVVGRSEVMHGQIDIEPATRLTDDERIKLIFRCP